MGPYFIGRGIDAMAGGRGAVDFQRLWQIALSLLLIYSISALFTWLQTYLMAAVSQNTVRQLREELFAKLQTLPLVYFDARPHGELMSRLTNDVEVINNTLNQSITQFFSSTITVLGSLGMMIWLSPLLTGLSLVSIPLGIFLTAKIAAHTRKYFGAQQTQLGQLDGYIEETITGQRIVKAFSRERRAQEEFDQLNNNLRDVGIRAQIFSGLIPPLMLVVNNLSFALVAGSGGWLAIKGSLSVGVIASFLNYSRQFARPINELANQFNLIQSGLAGAERVFEIMDEEAEAKDGAHRPDTILGEVEFRDVSFGYRAGEPVLKKINLQARPGQRIALVGPTGAGKTTIINLLTRFYEVDTGSILLDGQEIKTMSKDRLRESLGVVLQDAYLFSDTVRENIRYGRLAASDEQVEEAAKMANAHGFIQRLPQGYDTILSEEGGNLSQGQRQLLTIARAILADPAILILDEATSSVDTRTEMHLQEAMEKLMQGRTSFIIAHRLSTIRDADEILVINHGEIIERGTHDELLEARGFYHNLATTNQALA
jgi:ATP-binding cassette subfamily B protein